MELLKQKIWDLPKKEYISRLLDIGDRVYFVFTEYLIVPATIVQLEFVITHPDYPSTIWVYIRED